ncbi:uncharacterized protein C1orf131 homolog isoform X2 [Pipistrellus kuhlii]|nr:uncharacterized protein C1orf131 homolog isoform X2 [Pipistrellus kuhlii]
MARLPSVPGGAWAAVLGGGGGGVAAGGGSSARGGPTSPRAVAPSATAARDPGRRHLGQDGSRAGPCGARVRVRVRARPAEPGSECAAHSHARNLHPGGRRAAARSGTIAMAQGQGPGREQGPSSPPSPPPPPQLLDAVLQNLYDFGETEDGAERKRTRKKKENKKREAGAPVALGAEPAPPPGSLVRGPRKRAATFFSELRAELQGAPSVTSPEAPSGPPAPPAAASPCPRSKREPVEVVEFHSRNKKRKQTPDQDENTKTKTNIVEKDVTLQEFNLERARLEVHRFGITGYGKGKARLLERERAIMLGAQPPKKSYVNYKVLQEQIREKKAAKEEERRMARDTELFKKKKRKGPEEGKSRKKKAAPSILSNGRVGQVGKFRNGTLILSHVDIRKINSSRTAK